jgi:hypothetical protein
MRVRWHVAQRSWSEVFMKVCRQFFADLVERPGLARYPVYGDAHPRDNVAGERTFRSFRILSRCASYLERAVCVKVYVSWR